MLEVYKDLWRSDDDRENRQSYGVANENVRKLISGDDSADKAAKTDGVLDSTIAGMCDRMKIPLRKTRHTVCAISSIKSLYSNLKKL